MRPPTPEAPAASGRLPGLDGLRAVAILMVIAWHGASRVNLPPWAMGPFYPLIYSGWAGVDLFFALSGFLITSLLLREEAADRQAGGAGRFRLGAFYARRALRILPPFYCVLALNVLLFSAFLASARLPRFPPPAVEALALGTFWSNYYYVHAGVAAPGPAFVVLWSLCVEEHFYLLWPFVLFAVRGRRMRLAIGIAACTGIAVARYVVARDHLELPSSIHMLSHFRLDSILWGALGALGFDTLRARRGAVRALLAAAGTATVALFLAGHVGPTMTPLGHSLGLTLLAVTGTLLVLESAAGGSPLLRALDWAPLRELGRVSYGMYLLHFQAIDLSAPFLFKLVPEPSAVAFAALYTAFVASSYAGAWVLYRLVERPFLAWRDRWRHAALAGAAVPAPSGT